MKKAQHIVLLALLLSIILIGCGKKEKHLNVATEATETETTASAAAERETLSELPYRPGRMGVYVMLPRILKLARRYWITSALMQRMG